MNDRENPEDIVKTLSSFEPKAHFVSSTEKYQSAVEIIVMGVIKKSTRINIHKFVPLIKQNVRSKGRKQLINPYAAARHSACRETAHRSEILREFPRRAGPPTAHALSGSP